MTHFGDIAKSTPRAFSGVMVKRAIHHYDESNNAHIISGSSHVGMSSLLAQKYRVEELFKLTPIYPNSGQSNS